jgi:hypothetical protein
MLRVNTNDDPRAAVSLGTAPWSARRRLGFFVQSVSRHVVAFLPRAAAHWWHAPRVGSAHIVGWSSWKLARLITLRSLIRIQPPQLNTTVWTKGVSISSQA